MAEKNQNINAMEQVLQQKQQELQERIADNARILWRIAVKQQKLQKLQREKQELQRKIAELQEAEEAQRKLLQEAEEAQRKLQCQIDGARIAKMN